MVAVSGVVGGESVAGGMSVTGVVDVVGCGTATVSGTVDGRVVATPVVATTVVAAELVATALVVLVSVLAGADDDGSLQPVTSTPSTAARTNQCLTRLLSACRSVPDAADDDTDTATGCPEPSPRRPTCNTAPRSTTVVRCVS